ncbi:unnamed protein product [Didymodactylos carnosus]|uniref:NAD(P)(+)--arginine ADP-ribosyltransferase n=1 Tax=Didymodactylos carnosus TaxID=1234261 RepID=A0A813TPH0_9BILA|nr:unnamed protein product [Didymodactylos carnosus]CAF3602167.1 unnamed protein product [Didymodactylos carnosus]
MASQANKQVDRLQAQWYWKSNFDPWSVNEKEEWTKYTDIESEIIEDVFNEKSETKLAELDNYWIDLNGSIQISKHDPDKQRSIKRVLINIHENRGLREERFFLPQQLNKTFSDDFGTTAINFIKQWKEKAKQLPGAEIVDQAANGIIIEGKRLGQHSESEWIARQLKTVQNEEPKEIYKCCIRLYTKESFLYKLVNKTMRENDTTKADTLAPFCSLLLEAWLQNTQHYKAKVYRGAHMLSENIASYQASIGQYGSWDAFTSTSKSRQEAERFGNTLFIIDAKNFGGIELSVCSDYPHEEEVLLPPGTSFKIRDVVYDSQTEKTNIYLKTCTDCSFLARSTDTMCPDSSS